MIDPSGIERTLRERLDNWRVWVGIAYFGLAAVVVALFFVNQNTQSAVAHQARDEATHRAEIHANAVSQFNQCLASIPVLTKINGFIAGDRIIRNTLVTNSEKVYLATPAASPQFAVRKANWLRLKEARADAYEVQFPVPSKESCRVLKAKLLLEH